MAGFRQGRRQRIPGKGGNCATFHSAFRLERRAALGSGPPTHRPDPSFSASPGIHPSQSAGDAVIGALYGFFDGSIAGGLLAWMYNWLVGYR
jgi:hypothetical protein